MSRGGARRLGSPGGSDERPAVFFADADEFWTWLEEHHDSADELWMELRQKHVAERGLTWAEAVPVALCFGWIDSLSQPVDEDRRRQRWTPRRPGSTWSQVNLDHAERLREEGLMHPAGEAAFARRRDDRTGTYSYERVTELAPEYLDRLARDPRASAFWRAATPGYRRSSAAWVMQAKREVTRERRMTELLAACQEGRMAGAGREDAAPAWVSRARAAQDGL